MSHTMWDERYSAEQFAYGKQPNDFLKAYTAELPVGKTICLGEGEGRNAVYLARMGHEVTAVDSSIVGLNKAQKLAQENDVTIETIHADLEDYIFAQQHWDNVVSIFCHLPADLRVRVHAQIVDTLKPGGYLILEAYTPQQLAYATGGPPVKDMMMSLSSLQQELSGLQFVHALETIREVYEGSFHNGKGAVVQLIAQK